MKYHQKPCTKTKKLISKGKRRTLSEIKPVENINKNPRSFLEISPVRKKGQASTFISPTTSFYLFKLVSTNLIIKDSILTNSIVKDGVQNWSM